MLCANASCLGANRMEGRAARNRFLLYTAVHGLSCMYHLCVGGVNDEIFNLAYFPVEKFLCTVTHRF